MYFPLHFPCENKPNRNTTWMKKKKKPLRWLCDMHSCHVFQFMCCSYRTRLCTCIPTAHKIPYNMKFIEWSCVLRDLYNFNCLEYRMRPLDFCTRIEKEIAFGLCVLTFEERRKLHKINYTFCVLWHKITANHHLSTSHFLNIRTFP